MMNRFVLMVALVTACLLALAPGVRAQGGSWVERESLPEPRFGPGVAEVNGRIFVMGGSTDAAMEAMVGRLDVYNATTDRWVKKAEMPTARFGLAAAAVGDKVYAIGGWNGKALPTVEEYDTVQDIWVEKGELPEARYTLSATTVNGKVYVMGGRNHDALDAPEGQGPPGVVFEYDPESDTWATKTPGHAGHWISTTAVDGIIYAFGSAHFFHEQGLAGVDKYDPVSDVWTGMKRLPKPMITAAATVEDQIYVVGGWSHWDDQEEDQGFQDAMFVVDPATEVWTSVQPMPTPRRPNVVVVFGRLYAIGGARTWPPNPLGTVEMFTPDGWIPRAVSPQGKLAGVWAGLKVGM